MPFEQIERGGREGVREPETRSESETERVPSN